MPPQVSIRSLLRTDDLTGFTCGDAELDDYFRTQAGQQVRTNTAGVLVALANGEIVGFATTRSVEIEKTNLPVEVARRLPSEVPVLRLLRLGVAERLQRQGIGRQLLRRVLDQALDLRTNHGCVGVLVDAKPTAVRYYEQFQFVLLPEPEGGSNTTPMFLPIKTILASAQPSS